MKNDNSNSIKSDGAWYQNRGILWVWMRRVSLNEREPFKPREEREWWETALDRRPLKIFFLCLYDLPISMINYCVWVLTFCMQSMCLRRMHFWERELLRLGEITFGQEMVVDRSELPWRLEMATNRPSTKWSSKTHAPARLASLI